MRNARGCRVRNAKGFTTGDQLAFFSGSGLRNLSNLVWSVVLFDDFVAAFLSSIIHSSFDLGFHRPPMSFFRVVMELPCF